MKDLNEQHDELDQQKSNLENKLKKTEKLLKEAQIEYDNLNNGKEEFETRHINKTLNSQIYKAELINKNIVLFCLFLFSSFYYLNYKRYTFVFLLHIK